MKNQPNQAAVVLNARHTPADDVDAIVTIAAAINEKWVIRDIGYSYDAAPGADDGMLTIESPSGTILYEVDIGAQAGPGHINFFHGLQPTAENQAVIVTLNAGGSGIMGKLNVNYQ